MSKQENSKEHCKKSYKPLNPSEIRRRFEWEDKTIYLWTIYDATPAARKLLIDIFGHVSGIIWTFIVLLFVGFFLPHIAFWLSFVASISAFLLLIFRFPKNASFSEGYIKIFKGYAGSTGLAAIAYSIWSPTSFLRQGFEGDTNSAKQWFLLLFQNIISVVTVDVIDLDLSSIQESSYDTRIAITLLKAFFAAGVIEYVFQSFKLQFEGDSFDGTIKKCFWQCEQYHTGSIKTGLVVTCKGKVLPINSHKTQQNEAEEQVSIRDLRIAFQDQAMREARSNKRN